MNIVRKYLWYLIRSKLSGTRMESSRNIRWDRKSRISELYPRCGGDMGMRVSTRKTRKRSKEMKLCIVLRIHTFSHPHSYHLVRSSFSAFRIYFRKEFCSDFECEVVHFIRVAISQTPASCCCNVLIPRGESHVATYRRIRIVCIAQDMLAVVTWWKRKLVRSFNSFS